MAQALSINEAAQMLDCPQPTLATRWWRRRHGIAAVRVGRRLVFLERDLEAWLEGHREPWGPQPAGKARVK